MSQGTMSPAPPAPPPAPPPSRATARPAAPPAQQAPAAPAATAAPPPAPRAVGASNGTRQFSVSRGALATAQLVCIYGPGGIGKSTLAALAPNPLVIDLDGGTSRLDVARISDIQTFAELRAVLQDQSLYAGVQTVVIDTLTRAEELAVKHTLETVPRNDQGQRARSVEDYGYGKGYVHVYETFLTLWADIEAHKRAGRNVIVIAHDCTTNVPNPMGEDWIQFQPMLQSPSSGKASIRLTVRNTADHVLFIGYDVVTRDGKGRGSGTRTIHPVEQPHCMAKSRTLRLPLACIEGDATVWAEIFGKGAN